MAARLTVVLAFLLAGPAAGQTGPATLRPFRVQAPPPLLEEPEPDDPPPYRPRAALEEPAAPPQVGKPTLLDILTGLSSLTVGGKPGYSASWYPDRPVEGQPADFGMVRQHLEAGVPVWREGDELLLATAGVRYAAISTDAILPQSGIPFPDRLWNVNLGLSYFTRLDNDWAAGVLGNFGSASDRPFHSTRELTASVAGVLRVPARREGDAWLFALYYSPVADVNYPIPLAAYDWHASPSLRLLIGLPAGITWTPDRDTTLVIFYLPVLNLTARLTHRVAERVAVSAGYTYFTEGYFLAGRLDTRERFLGYEQRVSAGVRWEAAEFLAVEGFAGYAFGRSFGRGKSQIGDRTDRVDVEAGAFLGAALRVRF